MKNLKDYIVNENNFFKNLGIGRKIQTEKWLQEHDELFDKRQHIITVADDGSLVITVKDIASLSYRHLEVPEYVTVSKIIFEKNSYNYLSLRNMVFKDFRGFIENVDIEFSNSYFGKDNKTINIENCNITVDDIKYIPSSFNFLTFVDCPNIKGNIDITRESDDFKTNITIENCKVNKINLNSKSYYITLTIDDVLIDSIDDINVKNGDLRFLYLKESPLAKIIIKELETLAKSDFDEIVFKTIKNKFNRILSKSKTLMEIINKYSEILLIQLSTKRIDVFIEYNPKKGKHDINEVKTK
jgi:hypothetical protein